jgi:hypothetical protein
MSHVTSREFMTRLRHALSHASGHLPTCTNERQNTSTMVPELTKGTCQRFNSAQPDDPDVFHHGVHRSIPVPQESGDHRAVMVELGLTDTESSCIRRHPYYMQAMLATQLNSMVQENQITKGSIVVLERLTCNYVQEKRCASRVIKWLVNHG